MIGQAGGAWIDLSVMREFCIIVSIAFERTIESGVFFLIFFFEVTIENKAEYETNKITKKCVSDNKQGVCSGIPK